MSTLLPLSLTAIWIVTLIHVLGMAGGAFLAIGSVISIANMRVAWAGWLLIMALAVPVVFGLSIIGAWWVYLSHAAPYFSYVVAFPWVFIIAFVVAMVVSFRFITP